MCFETAEFSLSLMAKCEQKHEMSYKTPHIFFSAPWQKV
jgi:hypothetical protein